MLLLLLALLRAVNVGGDLMITLDWPDSVAGRERPAVDDMLGFHKLQPASLWSLCRGQQTHVQLGVCSNRFIECSPGGSGFAVRSCPFNSFVFMNGKCLPADHFAECQDSAMNLINEETEQLIEMESFCANGAGVYLAPQATAGGCSRQAVICHPNKRDAVSVLCPVGTFITNSLQCAPAPLSCPQNLEVTAPIRQFFLYRACASEMGHGRPPKNESHHLNSAHCTSWYIVCHPQPSMEYCEAGEVFDWHERSCRKWSTGDVCAMAGVCGGNEWESVAIDDCASQFVYCQGSIGKLYTCKEGMVFSNDECRPREAVKECRSCRRKERRPGRSCDEYYECVRTTGGRLRWKSRRCPDGTAFNPRKMKCQLDYMCASSEECVPGTSFPINCRDYMYCTGEHYEKFSCPPTTRWDVQTKLCTYDPSCRPDIHEDHWRCTSGDSIPSTDCLTYQICQNGTYTTAQCKDMLGYHAIPCSHCFTSSNNHQVDQLTYPGQCSTHDRLPHPQDCTAYYVCEHNNWEYRRCDAGEVFDADHQSCRPGNPWECKSHTEVQCRHGEIIIDPSSSKCNPVVTQCQHGRWVNLQCPVGYRFDETTFNCVLGGCEDVIDAPAPPPPPMPPIENQEGRIPEFVAPSCDGTHKIPDQYDCARFWQCDHTGRYHSMACPPGSVFDRNTRDCVVGQCSTSACVEKSYQPTETCGHYKVCHGGQWIDARCNHGKQFMNGKCTDNDCGPFAIGKS
ncbi:hypothetical protein Q1695_008668 [Nippostrongylus brasiliensis]|nr:hypothetical protein Q1695_008668 [Nippostrongylus brasiliensis]